MVYSCSVSGSSKSLARPHSYPRLTPYVLWSLSSSVSSASSDCRFLRDPWLASLCKTFNAEEQRWKWLHIVYHLLFNTWWPSFVPSKFSSLIGSNSLFFLFCELPHMTADKKISRVAWFYFHLIVLSSVTRSSVVNHGWSMSHNYHTYFHVRCLVNFSLHRNIHCHCDVEDPC